MNHFYPKNNYFIDIKYGIFLPFKYFYIKGTAFSLLNDLQI